MSLTIVEEVVAEEAILDGELREEPIEDNLEERLVEKPVDTIMEEKFAEGVVNALSNQEELVEGNDPEFVGAGSGQCGDNVYWTLSKEGVLNISGSGSMWDANWDNDTQTASSPWFLAKKEILKIDIEPGVTSLGENAFRDCTSLESVTIGNRVSRINGGHLKAVHP